jgi:hypothetical protein
LASDPLAKRHCAATGRTNASSLALAMTKCQIPDKVMTAPSLGHEAVSVSPTLRDD